MARERPMRPACAVVVQPGRQACTWIVGRVDRPTLSGAAPDAQSAHRRGVFAATALNALERISRRGF